VTDANRRNIFGVFFRGFCRHDPGHPELKAWFDSLKSSMGLCCSFTDGSVSAMLIGMKGSHYESAFKITG
jgi:hypothetical protein